MQQPHNPIRAKHPKPAGPVQHGVAHGTPATRHMHALALSGVRAVTGGVRRRAKKALSAVTGPRKRRTARAGRSVKAHMVKGSAAAKAHMTKLRKMRGKKAA